jgi:hypothetical protein
MFLKVEKSGPVGDQTTIHSSSRPYSSHYTEYVTPEVIIIIIIINALYKQISDCYLIVESPAVTIRTSCSNVKYTAFFAHNVFVLYGSHKKQRLFPYTELTDWFL